MTKVEKRFLAAFKLAEEALTHSKPTASQYPEPNKRHETALKVVRGMIEYLKNLDG